MWVPPPATGPTSASSFATAGTVERPAPSSLPPPPPPLPHNPLPPGPQKTALGVRGRAPPHRLVLVLPLPLLLLLPRPKRVRAGGPLEAAVREGSPAPPPFLQLEPDLINTGSGGAGGRVAD